MDETLTATSKLFHLLSFLFLLSFGHSQTSDLGIPSTLCSPKNYTASIVFQRNVKNLLASLASKGKASGFYNDTVGAAPDHVYGLVLCRGDLNSSICGSCLRTAAQDIVRLCPSNKEAIIWYDYCLLRYADLDFFSPTSFNSEDISAVYNVGNISEAERPNVNPVDVVNVLVRGAPSARLMYLPTELKVGASGTRYGMAQCTRDLSNGSCGRCLNLLVEFYKSCCRDSMGWRMRHPNCIMRYEAYSFLPESNNLPASESQVQDRKKPSRTIILAIVAAAIVVIVIAFGFLFRCILKKRSKSGIPRKQETVHNHRSDPISTDFLNEDAHDENTHNSLALPLIDLETILTATNNYSSDNKLGEGGFGPVYKGILPDSGKQVAIKRLSAKSSQGKKEFMTEVALIAKLQHKNLVRLLYCCMEKDEMLLIYEYMPNKSLDAFIFGLPLHPFHPFL